jgi:[acyl-carrier-protein] S-malonyltransferase
MMVALAWVFPGQGSQTLGMSSDLAASFPLIRETYAEASEALGLDLWQMTQEGPEADLNATENTQPALLTAGVAAWRVWLAEGGAAPTYLAGHSLGEYTALVAAGVLSLADAVCLVAERGRLMQAAVPAGQGGMAAILGLDDEAVIAACVQAAEGEVVSAVNFNSVGQVVIAGNKAAVERAMALCKAAGAKRALPLPVSAPSHCALMLPAAEKLALRLEQVQFNQAVIPVVQNVAARVETDATAIRDALVRQLYSPVLWVQCVQALAGLGITHMIESGPGKILTGLNKRIVSDIEHISVDSADSMKQALAQV